MTQRFGLSSEKDGVATYREGENRRGGGRTDFGRKTESVLDDFNKSLQHPSGNCEKTVEYLEFRKVVWSGVINLSPNYMEDRRVNK